MNFMIRVALIAMGVFITFATVRAGDSPKIAPTTKPATVPAMAPTGIGVVDLDKVASVLGWQEEIRKNLEETKAEVAHKLEDSLKPAREALVEARNQIATDNKLSKDQIESLNSAKSRTDLEALGLSAAQIEKIVQAFSTVYSKQVSAQEKLSSIIRAQQEKDVAAGREAARDAVRRVARDNKVAIVFTQSPEVFYVDPAVDLTDQVIDFIQHTIDPRIKLPDIPKFDPAEPETAPAKTH